MCIRDRHYIHEMLLAFFTLLAGVGAWRWAQTRRILWAGVAGAGVGLMYATKETFIFCLVALFGALILTAWGEGGLKTVRAWARACWGWPLVAALAAAIVLSQLLFTSFLTNPSGPLDSLRTYIPWMQRAAGDSPHIHPWYFYLERLLCFHRPKGLWWSEGLILLLGGVGMLAAATPLPVIGVPVPLRWLDGIDALLSIVQMPGGVPVATVSIGGARNAGLLAARILGVGDPELRRAVADAQHDLARRQMANFSGMIAFQTHQEGSEIARRMVSALQHVHFAVSLAHLRRLIYWIVTDDILHSTYQHPPETAPRFRALTGRGIFRLSVGLEHPDDICADLARCL